jgi:hypothetical protein
MAKGLVVGRLPEQRIVRTIDWRDVVNGIGWAVAGSAKRIGAKELPGIGAPSVGVSAFGWGCPGIR